MLIENFASLKISFQFISPKEEILYFYMPEAFFSPLYFSAHYVGGENRVHNENLILWTPNGTIQVAG